MEAVEQDGNALKYAPPKTQVNQQNAKKIFRENSNVLEIISKFLRGKKENVLD